MFRQLLPMVALFISTAFLLAGGGVQGIIIPVRGQIEGFSGFQLGLIGAGWAIGFAIGCVVVPHLVRRVGHVRCFSVLAALLAVTVLMNTLIVEPFTWILLRAISGFCFAGSYMIIESWMNERVTNDIRGAVFSIYMIISQAAMMGGQYLLVTADVRADTLFIAGAVLFSLAVLPTGLSKAQSPAPLTQVSLDLGAIYRNSPAAAIGAIICGVISGTWLNFAPVYGAQTGMQSTDIANMVAVAMIGSIAFQYPLGKLSDLMDRRYVLIGAGVFGCAAGLVTSNFALPDGQPTLLFFALMFVLGGFIYPIYALVVAHGNDHADAEDFVKVSSGLLMLYGGGTAIGPLLTGPIMEAFGPNSIFTIVGVAHLVLAGFISIRVLVRSRPADMEITTFSSSPVTRAQTPETYALDPRSDAETYDSDLEPGSSPV